MPIFMDRHEIKGATAEAVAQAHHEDMRVQDKHCVRSLTYWFDEARGAAFCLVEAPDAEAVTAMHQEAHGLIPNEILEVNPAMVEAFLGRISDPERADGEPLEETAFRTVLFTDIEGSTSLAAEGGDEMLVHVLHIHNRIVREALKRFQGREVKHTGDGILASYRSVVRAVECAIHIQRAFAAHNADGATPPIRVRIGLAAGEPVEHSQDLFGSTVNLAARLCSRAEPGSILVAHAVRELCLGKSLQFDDQGETGIKGFSSPLRVHSVQWM